MNMTMSITGEKQLDESVWWLLQKLNAFIASSEKGDVFYLYDEMFAGDPSAPIFAMQNTSVDYLEKHGVIKANTGLLPTYRAALHPKPEDVHDNNAHKVTTLITVQQPKFDELYQEFSAALSETKASDDKTNITSLSFNDENGELKINDKAVSLPAYKNEHYLCRAMWEYPAKELVSWDLVYEKMTGFYQAYYGKPSPSREHWRTVYDAMEAVNKRIKTVAKTNDDLFQWGEKTIKRNF